MMEKIGTPMREKILRASARLFSEKGYKEITTRDIASAVGVKSASIYYHFPSKNEITLALYKYYADQRIMASPDLGELLKLAETAPPNEVLMKTEPCYDQETREFLDQILVAAVRSVGVDPEAERFIKQNIFDATAAVLKPLCERMVALGKIKPIDIDSFVCVLIRYRFGDAFLRNSSLESPEYQNKIGLPYIFSILRY